MDIGVIVRWGGVIPGKEKKAVELFAETTKLYGDRLAEGTFTYFEPFMFATGDLQEELGFHLIKGPEEKLMTFFDSIEARTLQAKVEMCVNHLKIEFLHIGDRVLEQVQLFSTLAEEKVPALV